MRCENLLPSSHDQSAVVDARECARITVLVRVCLGVGTSIPSTHTSLFSSIARGMTTPAPNPPIAAAPPPALVPPAVKHTFTRVVLPGADNTLDYVAVPRECKVVSGLPRLGWRDSSAAVANTQAAPMLSIAGAVCLPAFFSRLGAGPTAALELLSELLVVCSLIFLGRCADTCASLSLFDIPLDNMRDWGSKLSASLRRAAARRSSARTGHSNAAQHSPPRPARLHRPQSARTGSGMAKLHLRRKRRQRVDRNHPVELTRQRNSAVYRRGHAARHPVRRCDAPA
jgi:hypothetical protein